MSESENHSPSYWTLVDHAAQDRIATLMSGSEWREQLEYDIRTRATDILNELREGR